MIKTLAKSIREYKKDSILTPLFMIEEAEQRLLKGISREELNAFLDICDRICRNGEGETRA